MTQPVSRRDMLVQTAAAVSTGVAASSAFGIGPIKRTGKQRMRLSLAAYSWRSKMAYMRGRETGGKMTMHDFIDYCAAQGLSAAEMTSYFFPPTVTSSYLADLKRHAHVKGIDFSGGAIGNKFTSAPDSDLTKKQMAYTKSWIDHYAAMGVPVIRIFAGHPGKGENVDDAIKHAIANIETACEYAGKRGVMLAMENHDFTTNLDYLFQVVEGVKSPWFGINFDSGNLKSTPNPYADLERLVPYTINAQIKVHIPVNGKREHADLDRIIKILRDGGYSGYVVLEYEDKEDPAIAIPKYLDVLRKSIG